MVHCLGRVVLESAFFGACYGFFRNPLERVHLEKTASRTTTSNPDFCSRVEASELGVIVV